MAPAGRHAWEPFPGLAFPRDQGDDPIVALVPQLCGQTIGTERSRSLKLQPPGRRVRVPRAPSSQFKREACVHGPTRSGEST